MSLSTLGRNFINRFQGGFPLQEDRPFTVMAEKLETNEHQLLELITQLCDKGQLSRFGPIYNATLLGGSQTLAAIEVPEVRFAEVTKLVNIIPEVAHNYRREHKLNMWFVVASSCANGVEQTLSRIEQSTGLPVYNFPKQHEFYLGLWLQLDDNGKVDTIPVPENTAPITIDYHPDQIDRNIITTTQAGLPICSDPLASLADQLLMDRYNLLERMQQMLKYGAIRRIGAVPNHYRLGLRGNGMSVWDVPDELAVELGKRVGELDFVSHAYLRPRHPGIWRYNLFAMVHGCQRGEVEHKTKIIAQLLSPHCRAHQVLFSSEVLKKTGLRLAA